MEVKNIKISVVRKQVLFPLSMTANNFLKKPLYLGGLGRVTLVLQQ